MKQVPRELQENQCVESEKLENKNRSPDVGDLEIQTEAILDSTESKFEALR